MLKFKVLGKKEIINVDEKRNFLAKGGEATIYTYKNNVLKIYHDKNKMVSLNKIEELKKLNRNNIIKPIDILLNQKDEAIGFTMLNIDNRTLPIMRLFNTKFWKMNNLNINIIMKIVEFMQETLIFIHKNNCLIVDFNELNNLIDDSNFSIVYYIDTCAWKTPSFPAMAYTPFIRDYSKKDFDELTDWYSFAILIFQLFTGTHPFRGTHPKYKNMAIKEEIVKRMKNNASVYDTGVSLNSAVRNFSIIPGNYNKWFMNLFKYGKREFPPGTFGVVTAIVVSKETSKDNISVFLYREFKEELIGYKHVLNKEMFVFHNSILIDNKKYDRTKNIIFDSQLNGYEVKKENQKLIIEDIETNEKTETDIQIEEFLIIDNELYCENKDKVFHMKLNRMKKLVVLVNNSWNVMEQSSKIFNGVIYENILGKCWFFIPVYQKNWGISINIKEIDDYKIIECERKKNILMVIGKKKIETKKFVIKFNEEYDKYKVFSEKDDEDIMNFVVLENGIVISAENDHIEIFDSRIDKDRMKVVNDDIMDTMLVNRGNDAMIIEGKKISKITLK